MDVNNIKPRQHICPLKQEPPVIGIYFDVPNSDRTLSEQVFERSDHYRWKGTPGEQREKRNVIHPMNQQFVFVHWHGIWLAPFPTNYRNYFIKIELGRRAAGGR